MTDIDTSPEAVESLLIRLADKDAHRDPLVL